MGADATAPYKGGGGVFRRWTAVHQRLSALLAGQRMSMGNGVARRPPMQKPRCTSKYPRPPGHFGLIPGARCVAVLCLGVGPGTLGPGAFAAQIDGVSQQISHDRSVTFEG